MEPWTVCLLGVPRARCGDREIRLRSKKTWAVLACLLLPVRLCALSSSRPAALSRQTLARRFWGDKPDPNVHLRQALASLRATFGSDCLQTHQDTIRAAPGVFVTDIDRLRNSYQRALSAPPEECLHWLIEAEGEIGGPLLEACLRPGEQGESWLIGRRAEVHGWVASFLLALADAFEVAGNLNGAMEAARHAARFQPESAPIQSRVWRLAEQTGQEAALPALEPEDDLEQVVERIGEENTAVHLTGEETRLFSALYQAKLGALPLQSQKALPRLAVLPAPFSPKVAAQVARVSRQTLMALSRTPLLQRSGEAFVLPEVVRTCAWRSVPSATRQQLRKRLASFCQAWINQIITPPEGSQPPPFTTVAQAEPFLRAALQWHLTQPPTLDRVNFVRRLTGIGLTDLACEAVAYLDAASVCAAYPLTLRCLAAHIAGYILFKRNAFADAILRFEQTLSFVRLGADFHSDQGNLYFALGNACHYAGDSGAALAHLREAETRFQRAGNARGVSECLRFRAEIQNHLEEYEEALQACEEALAIRRILCPRSHMEADALFWKGSTLFRLDRHAEAEQCIAAALSIWQDTGNETGAGFCLRVLGRLHAEQGSFAEARAHIEHAILLHERQGDQGSRLAAMEARADVYVKEGRLQQALPLYQECIEARKPQEGKGFERLRAKIQSCQTAVQAPELVVSL